MKTTTQTARLLYLYSRYSTLDQGDGESLNRQNRALTKFMKDHDEVRLSEVDLTDKGRSGSKGQHLKGKGRLKFFVSLVKAGAVQPGSILGIENWDRFSRMKVGPTVDLFRAILGAGVAIAVLPTGDIFEPDCLNDPMAWTRLVWEFERAHKESARKAELTRDNWAVKRKVAAETKQPVTSWAPYWLDVYQDGVKITGPKQWDRKASHEYKPNAGVKLVQQVFDWADEGGLGCNRIVQKMVKMGLHFRRADKPTQATVFRLLTNPAVIGTYVPHFARDEKGKRNVAADPIEGYFPAVIREAQFYRVQTKLRDRKKKGSGPKGKMVTNLFGGIIHELDTGSPLYIKTSRGVPHLVAAAALRGQTSRTIEFPLDVFEKGVLSACRELSPGLLAPKSVGDDVSRIEDEVVVLKEKMARTQKRYEAARDEAEETAAYDLLAGQKRQMRELERALDEAKAAVDNTPVHQLRQLHTWIDVLNETPVDGRAELRSTIRGLLSGLVRRVDAYFQKLGSKKSGLKGVKTPKRAWVRVEYVSGLVRYMLIAQNEDKVVVETVAFPPGPIDVFNGCMLQGVEDGWE